MDEKVIVLRNAPEAVQRAVDDLDSPDPTQRKNALLSLSQISHPTAREALVASVGNSNWNVRIHAALVLVQFRDVRAVPGLIEALGDAQTPVGEEVARAVRELVMHGESERLEALANYDGKLPEADWSVSETAEWALVQFASDAVDRLLQALNSPDSNVQDAAGRALKRIADPAIAKHQAFERWKSQTSGPVPLHWQRNPFAPRVQARKQAPEGQQDAGQPDESVRIEFEEDQPTEADTGRRRGPTFKTKERALVFRQIKDEHPGWGYDKVAMEAYEELGEYLTGETVRNAYSAMKEAYPDQADEWTWKRSDRIR